MANDGGIGICNRALSEIGTRSTISSFDDDSTEAQQCGLWYDNTKTDLLRAAPWGFARRQIALTLLAQYNDPTVPFPWLYKYAYPEDCIKFRYLLPPPLLGEDSVVAPQVGVGPQGPYNWRPSRQYRFLVNMDVNEDTGEETKVLLSNVPQAIGVYTRNVQNPDLFDSLFNSALSSALSYALVIPLSGNVGMRQDMRKSAEDAILQARVADGNEAIPTSDHVVDWMAARNVGTYGYGNYDSFGDCGWGEWYSGFDNSWGM